jgi:hypothetical protein
MAHREDPEKVTVEEDERPGPDVNVEGEHLHIEIRAKHRSFCNMGMFKGSVDVSHAPHIPEDIQCL